MIRQLIQLKIKVHPLFWLVAVAAVWTGQFTQLMTLFTLVIIHELGHVVSAISFGWRVRTMELLPFGGVAKVDEWGTTTAKEEVIVALAGPLMNFLMILFAYGLLLLGIWEQTWGHFFIQGNLLIAMFNLIPAWPLDGGKILHAVLTRFIPFHLSIYCVLIWSTVTICCLLVLSFVYSAKLNLLVLSIYLLVEIWVAWKRIHYQFIRFLLFKIDYNMTNQTQLPKLSIFLSASDKIGEVVKMIKKGYYHHFHVLDEEQNLMVKLSEDHILTCFFKNPKATIEECIVL